MTTTTMTEIFAGWRTLVLALALGTTAAATSGCLIPYDPTQYGPGQTGDGNGNTNDGNDPPPDDNDPPPDDNNNPPPGDDTGDTCDSDADCEDLCIFAVDDPGAGICTHRCESFADCPDFWDCSDIGAAAGTYCTP